jgi:hypothetical protein
MFAFAVRAQESQAPAVDTAALEGKVAALEEQLAETRSTVSGLSRFKWSGYIQARYAWQEGVTYSTAEGTTANPKANPDRDNFFIRRGRLKLVYDADLAQFVLQIDATPQSGVSIKEGYAELKLPKGFAIDAGLQLLPFGYDVGVRSSADLDLLERYRGAGYWLKGEYDVGVTLRGASGPFNFRAGVFNGNGVDGGSGRDNDQIKDIIGRVGVDFGMLTGGISGWYGKTRDYRVFPNKTYDRNRIGADVQIYLDLLPIGGTALKGEFIAGKTGIGSPTDAGTGLGLAGHAWHATVVQNVTDSFQLAARYEQFVKDNNLVAPAKGGTVKQINELDVAIHYYVGGNYKLSLAYWHPMDGKVLGDSTAPSGSVKKTDQWVAQAQAKF